MKPLSKQLRYMESCARSDRESFLDAWSEVNSAEGRKIREQTKREIKSFKTITALLIEAIERKP